MNAAARSAGAAVAGAAKSTDVYNHLTQSATAQLAKFYDKMYSGATISRESMHPLIQQHALLKQSIEAMHGSISNADADVRAFYDHYTKEVEDAKNATQKLVAAVRDQSGELSEAGVQWRGLSAHLNDMLGKYGMLAAKAGVATIAIGALYKVAEQTVKAGSTSDTLDWWSEQYKNITEWQEKTKRGFFDWAVSVTQSLAGVRNASAGLWDLKEFGAAIPRAPQQYGPEKPDFAILRQNLIDQQREAEKAAELAERHAVSAANAARTRENEAAAMKLQLDLLHALTPMQKIELELEYALAAARRNHTGAMREQASAIAELQRQAKIDSHFAGELNSNRGRLGAMMGRAPGVRGLEEDTSAVVALYGAMERAGLRGDEHVRQELMLIEAWSRAHDRFVNRLTNVFADLAMTGGANFGEIAGQRLSELVTSGIASLFGTPGDPKLLDAGGNLQRAGELYDRNGNMLGPRAKTISRVASAAMDVAAVGMYGYQAGQAGEGGRMSGAMSGAAAGLAMGGPAAPFAAVAMAIVGYTAAVLGEKERQDQYKYAIPTLYNGQAGLIGTENIRAAERDQMIRDMQAVVTSTINGFVSVLLKLPTTMMISSPTLGADPIQDNPSGKFMKHWGEYLSGELPEKLAEMFRGGMEQAFTGSGMTKDAFNRFWSEAEQLDPQRRTQFWSDMADGISAWNRATANLAAAKSILTGDDPMNPGLMAGRYRFSNGQITAPGESEFTSNVRVAGEGLFRIAREFVNLTGVERVAAFRQLGQGVEQLTHNLQDFIQQVGQTLQNVRAMFGDARLEKELERAPDDQARANILNRELTGVHYQLLNAGGLGLSPAEIEQLTRRGIDLANQIYALDPTEAMYAWWNKAITGLESASTSALQQIAKDATDKVGELLTALDPFKQWMLGLEPEIDPVMTAFVQSIGGAVTALNELAAAVKANTPDKGDNRDGGGRDRDDRDEEKRRNAAAPVINVTLTGDNYGLDGIEERVIGAVRNSMHRNPNSWEPGF